MSPYRGLIVGIVVHNHDTRRESQTECSKVTNKEYYKFIKTYYVYARRRREEVMDDYDPSGPPEE